MKKILLVIFLSIQIYAWSLNGGLSDISAFKNSKIIWIYKDGKWSAYSKDENISNLIIKSGYTIIDNISPDIGFWSYDDIDYTSVRSPNIKLHSGWNLIGGISTDVLPKVKYIWRYRDGNWYLHSDEKTNLLYSDIKILNAKDGVWIYSKTDKMLNFAPKFIPFVDMSAWPLYDFNQTKNIVKNYAFAFINSLKGSCSPRWGGYDEYTLEYFKEKIDNYKSDDSFVSIGGASSQDISLAHTCEDSYKLYEAYKSILQTYDIKWLDFDIEGENAEIPSEIEKRFEAIKLLQSDYKDLKISLTLSIMPNGFEDNQKNIIQSAIKNEVKIYSINLMLMDYGENYPAYDINKTTMFDYSIEAIKKANSYIKSQLSNLYPIVDEEYYYLIGVTVMIGQNDIKNEFWYKNDFINLQKWALENGLRFVSFWSLQRDRSICQNCTVENSTMLDENCYGTEKYEFSKIATTSISTE